MASHASVCQSPATCLRIQSTAIVAAALAPIPISAILTRCSDIGLACRANATKLLIAGLIVSRADAVKASITSADCAAAEKAFTLELGWFCRVVLPSARIVNDELHVPWHSNAIRASDLLATLDQLSCTDLRSVLGALKLKAPRNTRKGGLTHLLMDRFEQTVDTYSAMSDVELRDWIATYYGHPASDDFSRSDLLLCVLDFLIPEAALCVLMTCPYQSLRPTARTLRLARESKTTLLTNLRRRLYDAALSSYWPNPVPEHLKLVRMSAYHTASQFRPAKPCACCGRARVDLAVQSHLFVNGVEESGLSLEMLRCDDPWLLDHPARPFRFLDSALDGLMLMPVGLVHHTRSQTTVSLCSECEPPIRAGKIPKLAIRNGIYRGALPPDLQDLTWVEERVCALYRATANITRLFGSSNPELPFVLYGNTCVHPQNILDTAKVLPRTAGDVADQIGVMFVGPGKYKPKGLSTFRVRRHKLIAFLEWLTKNNRLYQDIPLDMSRFAEYPDDGPLPGIENRVIHDESDEAATRFAQETAGLEDHPALTGQRLQPSDEFVFIDSLGITNSSTETIGAHTFEAAALHNLLPLSMRTPDMTLHRGSAAIPEYGNYRLFLGLYPTLFPFGIGGLEDWDAQSSRNRVGFRAHANYLIDLSDRRFSSHPEFMFVVVNILQRRAVHLETRFRLRSSHIEEIAPNLLAVTPEQIQRVASQIAANDYANIDARDRSVLDLLRLVEMVGAKVPGSHSMKHALRRKIFAMCRHYGVPQVYLTLNPSPVHSPLFHLMAGDESVDLLSQFPRVANSIDRSLRVASDPAMAAYFFELSIRLVFEHLLGWDFEKGRSTPEGGILGHLEAFAMSDELTNRGVLHGHAVIWLRGGLNPGEARSRLAADVDFQDRFFKFWDAAIHHHLPAVDFVRSDNANPRQERPPRPPPFVADLMSSGAEPTPEQSVALKEWQDTFTYEVKRMGEETQRHSHKDVCRKYGNETGCRFQFPHDIVRESYFDHKTNSIYLKCLDGNVNYFNPELLVMCRHNHDIKCILSGKAAQAAVYYITNYITKLDINAHNVLSMVGQAAFALAQKPPPNGQKVELRTLVHKCLARITHEQQLHAQKAARYIRGQDDSLVSHTTVPLMTGMLMQYMQKLYIPDEVVDEGVPDDDDGIERDAEPDGVVIDEIVPGEAPPDELDPAHDIRVTEEGLIEVHSQLEDYMHRGPDLAHLNYYDFVRLLRLVPLKKASPRRFQLDQRHSRSHTHMLEYRSGNGTDDRSLDFVPISLGPPIPRKNDTNYYRLYCLAHFKPFSAGRSLLAEGETIAESFLSFKFNTVASRCLNNWEALHECEDERDAERINRQSQKTSDAYLPTGLVQVDESGYTLDPSLIPETGSQRETYKTWATLVDAGWFTSTRQAPTEAAEPTDLDEEVPQRLADDNWHLGVARAKTKIWRAAAKQQEDRVVAHAAEVVDDDSRTTLVAPQGLPDLPPRTEGVDSREQPILTLALADTFAQKYLLNAEQRRAFNMTVSWLVAFVGEPGTTSRPKPAPLRMILHGPGGTGKTHSLLPIEDLLAHVRLSDVVVRIAPTGTSASLINGRTLHSALRLKIEKFRRAEETVETFEITWTPTDRKRMQDLFGSAILVLLDEFSLASARMLGQLDTALRMVKQNWDEPFGGVSIILSGDLCQYPPVGETALYVPLSKHSPKPKRKGDITLERLGRLAYKSFDTVIEFREQQRMRGDPAFGDAVRRLRLRECTPDDVRLFNTRVVKSEHRPNGVDLDTDRFRMASIITANNHTRAVINEQKAMALGGHLTRFFDVAADDRVKDGAPVKQLSREARQRVLKLVNRDPKARSLLGRLKLFEGMPVILRFQNVSVPLRITNGAQGFLRELSIHRDQYGEVIGDIAFVEFPSSPVAIPGLPPHVYPIQPITGPLVAQLLDPESKRLVATPLSRKQLPLEAAFAVTGHSAQGKTLPVAIADPTVADPQRGFYIYVSFSRAQNLGSLALLNECTLKILNSPHTPNLKFELRRLAALAHNTAVRAGDLDAEPVPVPEPELEANDPDKVVLRESRPVEPVLGKRKRAAAVTSGPARKTARKLPHNAAPARGRDQVGLPAPHSLAPNASSQRTTLPAIQCAFAGPRWDSRDWSCAYDAVLVAAYACWSQMLPPIRRAWAATSPGIARLVDALKEMDARALDSANTSVIRDGWRDYLSGLDASLVRHGAVPAEICKVLALATLSTPGSCSLYPAVSVACSRCGNVLGLTEFELPLLVDASAEIDFKDWLADKIVFQSSSAVPAELNCCGALETSYDFDEAPVLLSFEVDPRCTVSPSYEFEIMSSGTRVLYRLGAVTYITGAQNAAAAHFYCAVVLQEGVYSYDGAERGGSLEHRWVHGGNTGGLSRFGSGRACALVYYRTE